VGKGPKSKKKFLMKSGQDDNHGKKFKVRPKNTLVDKWGRVNRRKDREKKAAGRDRSGVGTSG